MRPPLYPPLERSRWQATGPTAATWLPVLGAFLLLALAGCSDSRPSASSPSLPAAPAPPETPTLDSTPTAVVEGTPEAGEGAATPWILREFDWGDSEEIVDESIDYAPDFLCFKFRNECRVVRAKVDTEELMARFQFHEDGLWRVALVTPPLSDELVSEHGPRVVAVLGDHVKRQHGEPATATPFPEIDELSEGTHILQHWKTETMAVEVVIVRRDSDYFVGVYFADPVRGVEALPLAADPTDPPEKPSRRVLGAMP